MGTDSLMRSRINSRLFPTRRKAPHWRRTVLSLRSITCGRAVFLLHPLEATAVGCAVHSAWTRQPGGCCRDEAGDWTWHS